MRRVLVVRLDSVGDVLLAGPAVRAIAASSEVQSVTMLCGPQGAPAARLLPGVDEVVTWACPWIMNPPPKTDAAASAELSAILERLRPTEAVIFTSFHQSPLPLALLLRMAGVPRISGASVDFAGSLLDVRLIPGETLPEAIPETERALAIAAAAGFPAEEGDDRLAILDPPVVDHLLPGGVFVAVHPGASVESRRWSPERHRATVAALTASGIDVVVTGSPAEQELTAFVAGDTGVDLGGRTNLAELAGVLARAAVLITGNTGPTHLAAAVGTPVVCLFSPVVPAVKWAPWGVPTVILGDQDAACRDSRATVCPVAGHPCLNDVLPGDVVEASFSLMSRERVSA